MRIDSGIYKGRKLLDSKFSHIRPTTDKVRQAIFVKLQFFLPDKKVLDLCCGTGALGIEALSRGAKEVVFVDKDFRSVGLCKQNLQIVGATCDVFKCDAVKFLEGCNEKFDLILFDPPYKSGIYELVIQKIFDNGILSEDGIIVCEHSLEDKFNFEPFKISAEKKYGDTILTYLEH